MPDSKWVNPYSFSNVAFAGSATAGSLLVWGEPEICHPENCSGRRTVVGTAGTPSPAKAVATDKISTEMILEAFMRMNRTGGRSPLSLDYRPAGKVSSSAKLGCAAGGKITGLRLYLSCWQP